MPVSLAIEVVPTGTVGAELKGVDIAAAGRNEVGPIKRWIGFLNHLFL
jgi:hypothetical protein